MNVAPHYIPRTDLVRVPDPSRYHSMESYYNTVFHELIHSTGHPKRLNRFDANANAGNLHEYGVEELVAGMGSAMLADLAGIGRHLIERDASYVQTWATTIRANRSIILTAAQRAQKALDFITGSNPDSEPDSEPGSEP